MELCRASQQTHGADEARKSQTMVAMSMGDEDMPDAFHAQAEPRKAGL